MRRASITPTDRVVVGVDGSVASLTAVEWAGLEAERLHRTLHLVHAQDFADSHTRAGETPPVGDADIAVPGEPQHEALASAVAVARRHVDDDSRVTFVTVPGSAVAALVEASRTAHTVVVGARGRGRTTSTVIGSVATQVVRHAQSPVVVVKASEAEGADARPTGGRPSTGRVVVGVDGSAHSQRCLAFAFEHASSRGAGLDVVHAWPFERSAGSTAIVDAVSPRHEVGPAHDLLVDDAVAGWPQKYPDVDVQVHSIHAPAVTALLHHADAACLLVVGSRGRGGFAGLVLGSVSHTVQLRAACPVAVVRGQR